MVFEAGILSGDQACKSYSRLAHLVGALRGIHDSERTIVAALTYYADASSDRNQKVVTAVGGFLAFEDKWRELEDRWCTVLAEAGVKVFHMTDFIACADEFERWKGEEHHHERRMFLAQLRNAICDCVEFMAGSYVILPDWREQNKLYEMGRHDFQPYALAGWCAVDRAIRWSKNRGYDVEKEVLFVFEDGDNYQENLRQRVKHDMVSSSRPKRKGRCAA